MSIKEQIDRIEAAKSSLKTAIEGKGVTVPSTTKIDGYGALVESIPAGIDTSDGTITPEVVVEGAVGYAKGQKVVGIMPNYTGFAVDGYTHKSLLPVNLNFEVTRWGPPHTGAAEEVDFSTNYDDNPYMYIPSNFMVKPEITAILPGRTAIQASGLVIPKAKFEEVFGTATAADVVKDKTFYGKNGPDAGTLEVPGAAKETWVLNSSYNIPDNVLMFEVTFKSNGQSFTKITVNTNTRLGLMYDNILVSNPETVIEDEYRKLIFNNAPSGDLLTWLQANGVKQPADVAVQDNKEITIITNGGTTITPDVPYDVLKSVKVIANIPQRLVPANFTIQSQSYSGDLYFNLVYYSPDGTIKTIRSNTANTLPITIQTVVNSGVVFVPSGWGGIPHIMDGGGCLTNDYQSLFYIVPTNNEAYIVIENID